MMSLMNVSAAFKLQPKLVARLYQCAVETGRDPSRIVRDALTEYLDQRDRDKNPSPVEEP